MPVCRLSARHRPFPKITPGFADAPPMPWGKPAAAAAPPLAGPDAAPAPLPPPVPPPTDCDPDVAPALPAPLSNVPCVSDDVVLCVELSGRTATTRARIPTTPSATP